MLEALGDMSVNPQAMNVNPQAQAQGAEILQSHSAILLYADPVIGSTHSLFIFDVLSIIFLRLFGNDRFFNFKPRTSYLHCFGALEVGPGASTCIQMQFPTLTHKLY